RICATRSPLRSCACRAWAVLPHWDRNRRAAPCDRGAAETDGATLRSNRGTDGTTNRGRKQLGAPPTWGSPRVARLGTVARLNAQALARVSRPRTLWWGGPLVSPCPCEPRWRATRAAERLLARRQTRPRDRAAGPSAEGGIAGQARSPCPISGKAAD